MMVAVGYYVRGRNERWQEPDVAGSGDFVALLIAVYSNYESARKGDFHGFTVTVHASTSELRSQPGQSFPPGGHSRSALLRQIILDTSGRISVHFLIGELKFEDQIGPYRFDWSRS